MFKKPRADRGNRSMFIYKKQIFQLHILLRIYLFSFKIDVAFFVDSYAHASCSNDIDDMIISWSSFDRQFTFNPYRILVRSLIGDFTINWNNQFLSKIRFDGDFLLNGNCLGKHSLSLQFYYIITNDENNN